MKIKISKSLILLKIIIHFQNNIYDLQERHGGCGLVGVAKKNGKL